jgi:hypothetical protein
MRLVGNGMEVRSLHVTDSAREEMCVCRNAGSQLWKRIAIEAMVEQQ